LCCLCCLCCCCCSVLADCFRLITGNLQEAGLQGPNKEAPTSRRIPRINNEPSRPTEGVRFCLSGRSAPLHQQSLFESNRNGDHSGSHASFLQASGDARRPAPRRFSRRSTGVIFRSSRVRQVPRHRSSQGKQTQEASPPGSCNRHPIHPHRTLSPWGSLLPSKKGRVGLKR